MWPASASDTLTLEGNGAVPNLGLDASPTEAGSSYGASQIFVPIALGAAQTWDVNGGTSNGQNVFELLSVESVSGAYPLNLTLTNGAVFGVDTLGTGPLTATGDGTLVATRMSNGSTTGPDPSLPTGGVTLGNGTSLTAFSPNTSSGPISDTGTAAGQNLDIGDGMSPEGTLAVTGDVSLDWRRDSASTSTSRERLPAPIIRSSRHPGMWTWAERR